MQINRKLVEQKRHNRAKLVTKRREFLQTFGVLFVGRRLGKTALLQILTDYYKKID